MAVRSFRFFTSIPSQSALTSGCRLDQLAAGRHIPHPPTPVSAKMNDASPASTSRRFIGCLVLLAYVFGLHGIAPIALTGLAAAGDHDHQAVITADGGQMELVLHHHDDASEPTEESHDHDEAPLLAEFAPPATGHGHQDHVIDLGSGSAFHTTAFTKPLTLAAHHFTLSWQAARSTPVWPREYRSGSSWARSPPGDPARMTCLRTTVLVI